MSRARDLADLGGSADAGGITGRNLIINGAMTVAQRGTSVSALTGSGYKTVDRWNTAASGATYNQSQETVTLGDSVIGDFNNYLKHDVTTGNADHGITYRVEDVQSVLEGTVTLSFYAKGTNPNGGHMEMIATQDFGTGGSPSSDVAQTAQDFTLTSSWQRFTLQITVPSLSGKTIGTDGNSYYQIKLAQPSDDSSTNAWELNITGVQLEVGETSTDFEHEDYGTTIQKCYRYYYKTDLDLGTNSPYLIGSYALAISGTQAWCITHYPVPMRIRPTAVEQSGTNTDYSVLRCGSASATACSAVPAFASGTSNTRALTAFTVTSGLTNGTAGLPMNQTTNGYLAWSAEL